MRNFALILMLFFMSVVSYCEVIRDGRYFIDISNLSFTYQAWIELGLSDKKVEEDIKKYAKELFDDKKREKKNHVIVNMIINLKYYHDYYFLEYDTKISKKYIEGIIKYIEVLYNARNTIENLENDAKADFVDIDKWKKYYQNTAANLYLLTQRGIPKLKKEDIADLGKFKKEVVKALEEKRKEEEKNKAAK